MGSVEIWLVSLPGQFIKPHIAPGVRDAGDAADQNREAQIFREIECPFGHLLGFLEGGGLKEGQVSQPGKAPGIFLIGG